jgi:hypothetical protein
MAGKKDIVEQALKLVMGESDNVTRLSDVKSARERDALIKQIKSTTNLVKSGYFQAGRQALINQKSLDLHKSGMLPLQQGTIVTPPSTWDMPGDWRVSGYWYDEKDPRRFGYKIQNESGQTYDAVASDPRAGLRHNNPYNFGGGFKAYAGPNAAPPKPIVSPVEKPAIAPRPPEVLDAINKEYEDLFGNEDLFKPKAHGGRTGYGPGGVIDDIVEMAGKIVSGADEPAKTGIRAYQGSPHDFAAERLVRFPDKTEQYIVGTPDVLPDVPEGAEVIQDFPLGRMRMDKSGTGEGAQAYGHGLYAAEAEPVAKGYRDALQFGPVPVKKIYTPDETARGVMNLTGGDIETSLSYLRDGLAAAKSEEQIKRLSDAINILQDSPPKPIGKMYEINIAADPNQFLDWDKPLRDQPQNVREALAPWGHLDVGGPVGDLLKYTMQHGADATKHLAGKGIPGIKYLDAGSRGKGVAQVQVMYKGQPHGDPIPAHAWNQVDQLTQRYKDMGYDVEVQDLGTRNYVVFDDKLISIIRKYGIAGASAMLGYNLMDGLDSKQALAATMADQDYQNAAKDDGEPFAKGGEIYEDDDINDALRIAKDNGGSTGSVFMTDAKGINYDINGNIIPPEVTGPNPARSEATPEQVGQRAAQDPATFDALMQKYAVPDQDIARYEATKAAVAKQPYETQQMTHVGAPPMRDVKVDMPLLGGEKKITQAPYNVAGPMSMAAQTAYDLKTVPLYFTPFTAPIGAGLDIGEGVATGDPLQASLAALGAPGKYAKAAIIGGSNYLMSPAEAQAGPARWFSRAMEVARDIPMNKMTGEQALAMLRKGVSPEELRWTGTDAFLSGQKSVTKDDLLDYIEKNRFKTDDLILGGNKPTAREDVRPTETAKAPFMEEWNRLKAEREAIDKEYYALSPDEQVNRQDEFWKRQFKIDDARTILKSKIVDATIAEMGGLGLPMQYGPGSRFGDKYVTSGGEGYGEAIYRMPDAWKAYNSYVKQLREKYGQGGIDDFPLTASERGTLNNMMEAAGDERKVYTSGHFPQYPGYLAHSRYQILDVTPPGANRPYKAWNMDEAQSDLAKAGRKGGFYDPVVYQKWVSDYYGNEKVIDQARDELEAASENVSASLGLEPRSWRDPEYNIWHSKRQEALDNDPAVIAARKKLNYAIARGSELDAAMPDTRKAPIGPYVKSIEGWTDLTIKKQLDQAFDSGADYFTWTPGAVQADRYNLKNEVSQIQYYKEGDKYILGIVDKENNGIDLPQESFSEKELEKYLGKEMANKIISGEGKMYRGSNAKSLEGLNLEIGGEGMLGFYDKIVPKRVQEVIRKATGIKPEIEVITVNTSNGPRKQLGVRLTDEMREKARFSDFNKGGRVTGGNTYDNDSSVAHALALTSEY